MPRTLPLTLATVLIAPLLFLLGAAPAHAVDKDCADFSTQAQAQNFYLANDPANDPHRLDGDDNDGIVCESLPCPCSTQTSGGTAPVAAVNQRAVITYVVDGDTADVKLLPSGARARVRMVGMNAPERNRCGYGRATRSLRGILPVGTKVTLVTDSRQGNKDRYGRLLRYVMKGTVDTNRAQVYRGMAKVFVVGNGFQRVTAYRGAQSNASRANRGLWSTCW